MLPRDRSRGPRGTPRPVPGTPGPVPGSPGPVPAVRPRPKLDQLLSGSHTWPCNLTSDPLRATYIQSEITTSAQEPRSSKWDRSRVTRDRSREPRDRSRDPRDRSRGARDRLGVRPFVFSSGDQGLGHKIPDPLEEVIAGTLREWALFSGGKTARVRSTGPRVPASGPRDLGTGPGVLGTLSWLIQAWVFIGSSNLIRL